MDDDTAIAPQNGITLQKGAKGTIHALSHEGRGIAEVNGKTVFLEGGLPGEEVSFVYQKRRKKFDEGRVVHVINPSPDRVEPKCQHFDLCGGCTLQHMESSAQILHKQAVLLEQLRHFGGVEPETVLDPLIGPVWGYRRKARLGVRYVVKKEKVLVGFREKQSHFILDLKKCEILHPRIGDRLPEITTLISNLEAYRVIPQIEVAAGDKDVALIFRHLEPLCEGDKKSLVEFAKHTGFHLYLQSGGPETICPLWPNTLNYLTYKLKNFDLRFLFHPADFTQVHADINQSMVERALSLLQPKDTDRVLDLFCGIGNFTLPLAKFAHQVVGVEGSSELVRRAEENALHNRINNVKFYASDLQSDILQSSTHQSHWAKECYDSVLLDPPRTGAFPIMGLIPKLGVTRVVYVSCNPATLARDVGELVQKHKFRLVSVGVMDMFPHTTHVESIALLVKP